MDFFKLFKIENKDKHQNDKYGKLFSKIAQILEGCKESEIKLLTGYAGLLGKVAYADLDISKEEIEKIRVILKNKLHLNANHLNLVIELLQNHAPTFYTIEDYIYGRLINEVADKQQKIDLISCLFEVAAADDSIAEQEDQTIRQIVSKLNLSQSDYVKIKMDFKKFLAVLKI